MTPHERRSVSPPARRAEVEGWWSDDPREDAQFLQAGRRLADPSPVPPDWSGFRNADSYEEPDEYFREHFDDPAGFEVHGGVAGASAGGFGGGGGGDEDEDEYGSYFEDDDNVDQLVDRTSAVTRNALEWAVVLVGAVLIALLLRLLLFQAYYIPSESMETTLSVNDRVVVNKISYRLHDINRGDIVVFARPDEQQGPIKDLIKRVIALPGETVEAHDNTIYINGQRLIEPYLDEGTVTDDFEATVVPEGHVFVMGDNRRQSFDSRRFGPIDADRVVGRAFVLFWPVSRAGSL